MTKGSSVLLLRFDAGEVLADQLVDSNEFPTVLLSRLAKVWEVSV